MGWSLPSPPHPPVLIVINSMFSLLHISIVFHRLYSSIDKIHLPLLLTYTYTHCPGVNVPISLSMMMLPRLDSAMSTAVMLDSVPFSVISLKSDGVHCMLGAAPPRSGAGRDIAHLHSVAVVHTPKPSVVRVNSYPGHGGTCPRILDRSPFTQTCRLQTRCW